MSELLFDLGDLVRIKNPDTGMSVQGVVSGHSFSAGVMFKGSIYTYDLEEKFTEITVLERKAKLPTEPGLYTTAFKYSADWGMPLFRLFRFTYEYGWEEMRSEDDWEYYDRDYLTVEDFAGRLRKLGVEDGN